MVDAEGESGLTHQLVVGCDREPWGHGLRGHRDRPEGPSTKCGQATGAMSCLWRSGEGLWKGRGHWEWPAEFAAKKQTPARAKGASVGSVLQGCPSEELRTSGAHLPLTFWPGMAEPGLWGSFSGRPHPQEGLSTPGKQYFGVGSELQWGWGRQGGDSPRPAGSSVALHCKAA